MIDLFAGAGGFSLGLQGAGASTRSIAVEIDPDCVETYRLNFPQTSILEGDIRDLEFHGISPDVVVGGPPCQGFSKLNRKRVEDPRNALSLELLRCVEQCKPTFVVVENVRAFLEADEAADLMSRLRSLGYSLRSGVVNAADFGVPQVRHRGLVIAAARGYAIPWPAPNRDSSGTGLPPHRTVADALSLLTSQPDGINWHRSRNTDLTVQKERFMSIPEGGARRDLPADLVLDCWKDLSGFSDVMGRLSWHRPAVTIRTEFFRAEKGRYLHPSEDRPITPREAARLQSFPDSFRFPEDQSLTSVARQIGNAMPPGLAISIGRAISRALTGGRRRQRRAAA